MVGWLRRRESGVDIRKLGEAPNPGLSDCISLRLMFPEQTTKDRSCKCTTCSFNPFQNLTKSEALLYESFRVCLQPMYNLQCQWSITAVNVNLDWIDVHELDNALLLNSWTINGLSKIWISAEKNSIEKVTLLPILPVVPVLSILYGYLALRCLAYILAFV